MGRRRCKRLRYVSLPYTRLPLNKPSTTETPQVSASLHNTSFPVPFYSLSSLSRLRSLTHACTGSALSQPVTHPRPISDEIIEATGRGMVGENLLFAGDWPLPNHTSAQSEPQINNSGLDTGYEREERPRSEDLYLDMEVGGKRESWDGIGSDGERHVRWKGLHA
ncbi:hypothetical protein BDV96DRAFT_290099 [Lophiotrema nucula]|uniref:Uncharacterized protein n=1 Tax=Lophiotrema nucula TaxID=690887 RepID=A0A6A5YLQ5_9PLEO|nr:hypothetical protein BDV96DRAFT_290099 [Lophiotrema nucula]